MSEPSGLISRPFIPLPLGSIRPQGWLARQLRLQADGISGHLDEFWPDVQGSRWFGGNTEGWERAPYWLDGLIPLAFILDDPALKAKASRYVDYILKHQEADGWLGPRSMIVKAGESETPNYDIWAQFLALKALVQYHEASGDERVVAAVEKNLRCIERHIDGAPLFNWGQFRWFEALIAIHWLYERTNESWLLDLATKLNAQGFDWGSFFKRWPLSGPTPKKRWNFMGHVVNNAMAIKAQALWWQHTGEQRDRQAVYDMIEKLDRYHGMVTGVFTGDECIAGKRPTQGTELCAVVEYAYSLEVLLSIFGDPAFGDRLEKIIFNALPATFSPDMWSHQYDQQANQVECSIRNNRTWVDNGPESNIFGVDPNYGCCTANLSQGWPKFAAALWMKTADEGLAAVAYAPSKVSTQVKGIPVTISLETDYPFRPDLHFTIAAEKPVRFPLLLRIPAWTPEAMLSVASDTVVYPQPGGFHAIEREWKGVTRVDLRLSMRPSLWHGFNGSTAVERGPLVYALKIGEAWKRVHQDKPYCQEPHADWEVYPTTPWNYALAIAENSLEKDIAFSELPMGERPFSPEGAPVTATVKGRRIPSWQIENGSADDVPASPVLEGRENESLGPEETLTLIPYGCTNLRVTEFPTL